MANVGACKEIGRDPKIRYVASFRNKGKDIGVSLTHPHGQIYGMPFVPPRIQAELRNSRNYWKEKSSCLFCDILSLERKEASRLIYDNSRFTSFMPFFAMWPFEVHIYPKRHFQMLGELKPKEIRDLADAIRIVTGAYSKLFEREMPYTMFMHQGPEHRSTPYFHFHVEFYPALRDAYKLKYAAGIEWGAGTFTYDGLPEERAKMLRMAAAEFQDSDKSNRVSPSRI
jgi:UDPglucose--hexose-1-phosphate uridylyltransferase